MGASRTLVSPPAVTLNHWPRLCPSYSTPLSHQRTSASRPAQSGSQPAWSARRSALHTATGGAPNRPLADRSEALLVGAGETGRPIQLHHLIPQIPNHLSQGGGHLVGGVRHPQGRHVHEHGARRVLRQRGEVDEVAQVLARVVGDGGVDGGGAAADGPAGARQVEPAAQGARLARDAALLGRRLLDHIHSTVGPVVGHPLQLQCHRVRRDAHVHHQAGPQLFPAARDLSHHILVLDGHLLDDEPGAELLGHAQLVEAADCLPAGVHLVVAERTEPGDEYDVIGSGVAAQLTRHRAGGGRLGQRRLLLGGRARREFGGAGVGLW